MRTPRSRPLGRVHAKDGFYHISDGLTGTPRGSIGPGFSYVQDGEDKKWRVEGLPAVFDQAARWARNLVPNPGLDAAWRNA